MKSIEEHRRALARQGIEPDCMPKEYWTNYAAKRRRIMQALKQGHPPPKDDCPSCRLMTD